MKMSDRFNLPMKVDGYSVESTPMRHHTYPCEVVSDIECDSGEDARAVAHAINNHDVLVASLETAINHLDRCHFSSDNDYLTEVIDILNETLEKAKGES